MADAFRPFQLVGARHLAANPRALLADQPGLGKTVQTVAGADLCEASHVLIICPAIARDNWASEWERWSELSARPQVIESYGDTPRAAGVVVISYEYARKNRAKLVAGAKWDLVVIDESHKLRTLETDDRGFLRSSPEQCHAIYGSNGVVRHARRKWLLTGTPAPKNVAELWLMLHVFRITKLTYEEWVERYCLGQETPFGFKIRGSRRTMLPEIHELMYGGEKPFGLRRRIKDVAPELPPITFEELTVPPLPFDFATARSFHTFTGDLGTERLKLMLEKERARLELELRVRRLGAEDWEILQLSAKAWPTLRRWLGMQKVHAIAQLVRDELEGGYYRKIVLFCQHRDPAEILWKELKPFHPLLLWGGEQSDGMKRAKRIHQFQNSEKYQVMICTYDAAAYCVTLTAAHFGIAVELSTVPATNDQAWGRLWRMTQEMPVNFRYAMTNDPLDRRIMRTLVERSRDLAVVNGDLPPAALQLRAEWAPVAGEDDSIY